MSTIQLAKPITDDIIKNAKRGLGSVPFEMIGRGEQYRRHARLYNDKGEGKWQKFRKLSMDVSSLGYEVSYVGSGYLKDKGYTVSPRTVILHASAGNEIEQLTQMCHHICEDGILQKASREL